MWNKYFDADEYAREHPDVAKAHVNARWHFLLRGNEEYRNPCRRFDMRYYLGRYPDVHRSGMNALLHFAFFGQREGRTLTVPETQPPLAVSPGVAPANPVHYINNQWLSDLPLVSVVIPCFNYGQFVEQAIRSVLDQTFPDLEIIVVEGGSTDAATVAEVRRLESRGFPKTRFYYRAERHLAGDNRNFGIGLARGRYICCLDADDLLRPNYIEVAVFLAEAFGYDVVTPCVQHFGDSDLRWLLPDPAFPAILTENQVAIAALFRRAAWAHVGGFRDWGLGADYLFEDWDFWIRLLGHGYRAKSIPALLLMYRVHRTSLSHNSRLGTSEQRERLRTVNANLAAVARMDDSVARSVLNPWANLEPLDDAQPGFLLALPYVTIGGAEKLLRTLGEWIRSSGRRLIVITSLTLAESTPDDLSSFERLTPHVYDLSKLFRSDGVRRQFLRYLIRRYSVSTLMTVGCEFVYHFLPELRREFPDLAVVDQLFNDSVHVFNNRHYSSSIDATIVPSEPAFQSLVERHGADPSSLHVIPHGIDITETSSGTRADILPDAGGKTVVGFFGRLSFEKAPDLFVEIVRALRGHDDLFFVMTGVGPERENIRSLIGKYRLEKKIYTPGFVDDVGPLMRAVDIVVLPSRVDGMPLVVLEAQGMGKPVVASRVGSVPSMITSETGFLCEVGDIMGFCRSILRLQDALLRERMGVAARESVARRFGSDRMLKQYDQVFRNVAKIPARRGTASGEP